MTAANNVLLRFVRPQRSSGAAPAPASAQVDVDVDVTAPEGWSERWVAKHADLVAGLRDKGPVSHAQLDVVRLYVTSWFEAEEAREEVALHGTIVAHPRTGLAMRNPYLRVARDAEASCVKLARVLGLSSG